MLVSLLLCMCCLQCSSMMLPMSAMMLVALWKGCLRPGLGLPPPSLIGLILCPICTRMVAQCAPYSVPSKGRSVASPCWVRCLSQWHLVVMALASRVLKCHDHLASSWELLAVRGGCHG